MGMFGLDHNHANSFFCGLTSNRAIERSISEESIKIKLLINNSKENEGLHFILF